MADKNERQRGEKKGHLFRSYLLKDADELKTSSGLAKLLSAAVVNKNFEHTLLHDPSTAIQKGYLGETFSLTKEEMDAVVATRGDSLAEFTRNVLNVLGTKSNPRPTPRKKR